MLKKGKKVLLLILAFALVLAMLAGCSGGWTGTQVKYDESNGGKGGTVSSNGGFVVQKGEGDNAWFYFINGVEENTADNTYGDVVKGSLMRISAGDMESGSYENAVIVVPELFVAGDYTAGVYIYGDSVYYATPNTIRNLDGEVESDYLNFRSANLDGSAMTDYYVQVSSNTTEYRYVQDEASGDVYLLYIDATNTEIHSYNTRTGVNTVLAAGYTSAEFDDSDPENPVVYYTMPVTTPDTYTASSGTGSTESYNQLYRVSAFTTESPYGELDMSAYTDETVDEGDENRVMEYVNLGTLVLDGIGKSRATGEEATFVTPFNHDFEKIDPQTDLKSIGGFSYSILRYSNGQVILSVAADDQTQAFALEDSAFEGATDWNSITANPRFGVDTGELAPIATSTTNITSSTFFYKDGEDQYYIYVDSSDNAIYRIKVGGNAAADYIGERTVLARNQSGATIVFADPIDGTQPAFLYFSMTGTNGNNLYRIQYNAAPDSYNSALYDAANFRPTQYLAIDYNSSWYKPESVGGYLFFANAESYSENYVYAMSNPDNNDDLETLNEQYEAVNDMFTEMDTDFGDAANLARYYYYGGDLDTVRDETGEHYDQYQAEDFEVLDAFINCAGPDSTEYNSHGFDFSGLKGSDGKTALTRNDFYKRLGSVNDDDAETIADNLIADLVLSETEEETSDAWTWQWAAIFVPVGVVVIAGAAAAVVFVRRKKRK